MKRALDHLEELLDDPRHRVGLRQVAAHHRGVDQVHRDGDGLVLRERLGEPAVDVLEHAAGAVELAGIEVLHLGAQGHLELDALVHPLDGKAEVVGDRDEGRRGDRHPDEVQGLLGQGDVLRRYGGDQPAQRVGVSTVGRLEDADDLERVDLLAGASLEAEATSGEHDLGAVPPAVPGRRCC